jgi:hypothetical protein
MHQAVKQEASQWRDKLLNLQQVAQDTQGEQPSPLVTHSRSHTTLLQLQLLTRKCV